MTKVVVDGDGVEVEPIRSDNRAAKLAMGTAHAHPPAQQHLYPVPTLDASIASSSQQSILQASPASSYQRGVVEAWLPLTIAGRVRHRQAHTLTAAWPAIGAKPPRGTARLSPHNLRVTILGVEARLPPVLLDCQHVAHSLKDSLHVSQG